MYKAGKSLSRLTAHMNEDFELIVDLLKKKRQRDEAVTSPFCCIPMLSALIYFANKECKNYVPSWLTLGRVSLRPDMPDIPRSENKTKQNAQISLSLLQVFFLRLSVSLQFPGTIL